MAKTLTDAEFNTARDGDFDTSEPTEPEAN